jgi:hypothetical protein
MLSPLTCPCERNAAWCGQMAEVANTVDIVKQQRSALGFDLEHAAGANLGSAGYLDPRHVVLHARKRCILPIS